MQQIQNNAQEILSSPSSSTQQKEHSLNCTYCIWYRLRTPELKLQYSQGIKLYGTFSTVEGFWRLYSRMLRSNDLPLVDVNVFVKGVEPVWEDQVKVKLQPSNHLTPIVAQLYGSYFQDNVLCGININVCRYLHY